MERTTETLWDQLVRLCEEHGTTVDGYMGEQYGMNPFHDDRSPATLLAMGAATSGELEADFARRGTLRAEQQWSKMNTLHSVVASTLRAFLNIAVFRNMHLWCEDEEARRRLFRALGDANIGFQEMREAHRRWDPVSYYDAYKRFQRNMNALLRDANRAPRGIARELGGTWSAPGSVWAEEDIEGDIEGCLLREPVFRFLVSMLHGRSDFGGLELVALAMPPMSCSPMAECPMSDEALRMVVAALSSDASREVAARAERNSIIRDGLASLPFFVPSGMDLLAYRMLPLSDALCLSRFAAGENRDDRFYTAYASWTNQGAREYRKTLILRVLRGARRRCIEKGTCLVLFVVVLLDGHWTLHAHAVPASAWGDRSALDTAEEIAATCETGKAARKTSVVVDSLDHPHGATPAMHQATSVDCGIFMIWHMRLLVEHLGRVVSEESGVFDMRAWGEIIYGELAYSRGIGKREEFIATVRRTTLHRCHFFIVRHFARVPCYPCTNFLGILRDIRDASDVDHDVIEL